MGKAITRIQERIVEYIRKSEQTNGYPPTIREICDGVGLKSTSSVHAHMNTLQNLGYLTWAQGKPRTIKLTNP